MKPRAPHLTVKARLALLFTVLVALILGVFGSAFYAYAAYLRSREFFSELRADAVASATIVLRSDNLSEKALRPYRRKLLHKLPTASVDIFDSAGADVFHSGDRHLRVTPAERALAQRAGAVARAAGDTQVVFLPFDDEGVPYVVGIAGLDEGGLRTLSELRLGLLAGYAAALLAVFAAGSWFAARAMAPIVRITRKAEGISAPDLHMRIEEGGQRDELSQLARAFNGMLDRLETAFRSQRQFIANASHELRTPLTVMEGQLEVAMMQERAPAEYRSLLASIHEDVRGLKASANNLLQLARAEAAGMGDRALPQRVDELLFSALEETKRRYPGRAVELRFRSAPEEDGHLAVLGQGDLLRGAVLNLLDNALKYSPPPAPVRVGLESDGRRLRLKVEDSGPGIPEGEREKVFEPFFRGEGTQHVPGSGIGLTLVKAIVERHGGKVELATMPGRGTAVTLEFPVAS